MSRAIRSSWGSFVEGFVGSFRLAAAIILAVVGVASAFVNDASHPHRASDKESRL